MSKASTIQFLTGGLRNTLRRILTYSLGYIAVGTLVTYFLCDDCFENVSDTLHSMGIGTLFCVVLWEGNGLVSWYLDQRISWLEQPRLRLGLGIVSTVAYTAAAIYVVSVVYFSFVLGYAYANYVGSIKNTILISIVITFLVSTTLHARAFLMSWRETTIRAEQLKQEQLKSQFASLKNQLNPHFLFNSLNVLSTLVYKDADLSARFIKQLAQVYR